MFAGRMRLLLIVAVVLGVLVSVLGILLQGASAAGVSLWASLKHTVLQSTLESRFGKVWGLRALDWLVLGVLLMAATAFAARARTNSSPGPTASTGPTEAEATATIQADASALAPLPPRWLLGADRRRRGLPGDHARAQRPREHPEPHRRLPPLRHPARARRERLGRRDRLPAARAGSRDPRARPSRAQPAAARDARAVLPARARRGDRDRGDRGRAGLYRCAHV